jgi:hypothetical protein
MDVKSVVQAAFLWGSNGERGEFTINSGDGYHFLLFCCSIYWIQLSRFYLRTETESSLRNVVFFKKWTGRWILLFYLYFFALLLHSQEFIGTERLEK